MSAGGCVKMDVRLPFALSLSLDIPAVKVNLEPVIHTTCV